MASDLSSGCTDTIDVFDEKEEGEISLEDVSSSEEGGIGHLTCGYAVRSRRSCNNCRLTGECASWCTNGSKTYRPKSHSRRDAVKGKVNHHHVNEAECTTSKHVMSALQEKNNDLVPISSDSDMEIVGITDTSKQLASRSSTRIKKKKRKKEDHEYLTIDDLISPSSIDLSISDCFSDSGETSITKGISLNKAHYRDSSPFHRSGRSRMISKSPLRKYKSPVKTRSTFGSSFSPLNRSRLPLVSRRSPRRLKSPLRRSSSPYRSPVRKTSRKLLRPTVSPPSPACAYVDRYGDVTRLLKKVKYLDSMGVHALESDINKSKEYQPASLKKKLSNMMKRMPDDNGNMTSLKKNSSIQSVAVNDIDDEEDLALLRQKALETKQKNRGAKSERPSETESERKLDSVAAAAKPHDDQDKEDLELRMIALRSAVMKKHQNRIQRGIRAKSKKTAPALISSHSVSPITQSFLNNIPIPGDEPARTSPLPPSMDSNHIEDMELDTDVEREKEKLSDSRTVKITANTSIDTELLGIDPSDVSFINFTDADNSSISTMKNKFKCLSTDIATARHESHYEASSKHMYSPSPQGNNGSFHMDSSNDQRELSNYLKNLYGDSVECDLINGVCYQGDVYSSTNTSMYDGADVSSRALPVLTANLPVSSMSPKYDVSQQNITQSDLPMHVQSVSREQSSGVQDNECVYEIVATFPVTDCPAAVRSTSPKESTMTINDPPEAERDPVSPLVFIDGYTPCIVDHIPNDEPSRQIDGTTPEPLYIQGVPSVTKDTNKIPTLINRTLVPAPILKLNKQLQQPLPPKKHETGACTKPQSEPTFKSAEMQPVVITTDTSSKNNTTFKPIKLSCFTKKPCSVLTTPVVFDESINENLENDASKSDSSHKTAEPKESIADATTTNNEIIPAHKKRKRVKKNRRKSHDASVSPENEKDNSCTNDVNKNIITTVSVSEQQIESDQNISINDNKVQKDLTEKQTISTNKKSLNLPNIPSVQNAPLSIDSSEVQNDNVNRGEQCVFSNDSREESKRELLSMTNEHQKEVNTDSSNHLLTNLDTAPPSTVTELTKDLSNRRESVDEDEDELRVILLASLAKRTTKCSNVNNALTGTVVTTNCTVTNAQQKSPQNVLMNTSTLTLTTDNTTTSNNVPLSSPLNSSKINESISGNTTTAKKTNDMLVLAFDDKKKRPAAIVPKGPPKKLVKKVPIPASTKAVNNAKKYQNMMLQRKLNLQKHDANMHNNKVKLKQDSVWSANAPTKTSTKIHTPETQRIVINLGSDTDSESEPEKHIANTFVSSSNIVNTSTQDTSADFEKSLHKFLRDMRKEQESAAAYKPVSSPQATRKGTPPMIQTDPDESSSNMHTPLAVRHLPASQQEEYRRLKQQILEREKLKLQRKVMKDNINNNGTNRSNKLLNNVSGSQLKSSLSCDNENTSSRHNQINLKELEKNTNFQQSSMGVRTKNIDITKNTPISNVSRTSINQNISENVVKQTDSMHLPAKTKKTIPNFSIRITNEIASTLAEGRIIENSVDSVGKQQPMSDKQQFRPAVRTLSKDEINKKYVQVRLKQDMIGRVVTINDKSLLRSNVTNIAQHEKSVENIVLEDPEINVNKNCDSSEFSNASTIVLFNLSNDLDASKQKFTDSMETTMSRSEYEREQEIHRNLVPFSENNNHNDNDISRKSDVYMSNDKDNMDEISNTFKKNVNELDSLVSLSEAEQRQYLSDTEQRLVERRYIVLDYLAEMSGTLRQWDMEKDLQSSLTTEVKNLKEQLRIAEEKLQQQRNRVNNNNEKISTTRQKINAEQRECFKLLRICSALGNRFIGKDYKVPEAGGQVLTNKLKEVTNHIRQLSKKKLLSNDISENSMFSTSLLQTSLCSEQFKVTSARKNSQLEEQPTDDAAKNMVELKDNTFPLELFNDTENSPTLDTFPNRETPVKKNQTATKQKDTPNQDNILLSKPRLCSTPISQKQNSECTQRTSTIGISEPATITEPLLSMVDSLICEDSEQGDKKRTHLLSLSTTTMTTTTKTTTIQPYVSILTHLKTPRNTNPNGILCPYDLMGICNDGDCRFVHQSTSHT